MSAVSEAVRSPAVPESLRAHTGVAIDGVHAGGSVPALVSHAVIIIHLTVFATVPRQALASERQKLPC